MLVDEHGAFAFDTKGDPIQLKVGSVYKGPMGEFTIIDLQNTSAKVPEFDKHIIVKKTASPPYNSAYVKELEALFIDNFAETPEYLLKLKGNKTTEEYVRELQKGFIPQRVGTNIYIKSLSNWATRPFLRELRAQKLSKTEQIAKLEAHV